MPDSMLFWVTRSAPFNTRTRDGVAALGHRVVTMPVLEVRRVRPGLPRKAPTAIAFTSAHGVRHHPLDADRLGLPVFTVGHHSADRARRRGYEDVRSADGDVGDLYALIRESLTPSDHLVLYGAREPAGSLTSDLAANGIGAELAVVYESVSTARSLLDAVVEMLPAIGGIVVHSPKGAAVAASVVEEAGWRGRVFGLSSACAEPFRRLAGVEIAWAPAPTETALIGLIRSSARGFAPRGERASASALRLVVSNDLPSPDFPRLRASQGSDDPPPTAA